MNNGYKSLREFGNYRLDIEKKILWCEEKPVSLPLKAIELLCVLVERPGAVVTKDEIWRDVWRDAFVEETNLTHNIYLLRKVFKDSGERDLIQTVPRRGYRFAGEIREAEKSEIMIEKHTRTQTVIEIEEVVEDEASGRRGEEEEKRFVISRLLSPVLAVLLLVVVGGAFVGYQRWQPKAAAQGIRSIAVLPFTAIDRNRENEREGLGMADVLITRLSSIREITVRPTSAVAGFDRVDSIAFGQKLQADAILEGTIYRADEKIRVTARLVKTSDASVIWSGQFEKIARDELKIQNEIALQVVDALAINLTGSEKHALEKLSTENPDAYQLYTKGRYYWNRRNWEDMIQSEQMFRQAIEKDPKFSLAYVGLADTLAMRTGADEPENAVQKALELDPSSAEAYASLGFIKTFHYWKWREAEESFKKSIELNPNYATAHHWYAQVLTIQGRHEEAKAAMRRALEINPLSYNFLADLGQIYYFNREYDEAKTYCLKALEINPEFSFAYQYLQAIYLQTGEYEKAVEAGISASKTHLTFVNESGERRKHFDHQFETLRKIYREQGVHKYAENLVGGANPTFHYLNATRYAFIGEREKTLDLLEKAHEGRGFLSAFVKADPVFDSVRDEPRYREILRKMNLP